MQKIIFKHPALQRIGPSKFREMLAAIFILNFMNINVVLGWIGSAGTSHFVSWWGCSVSRRGGGFWCRLQDSLCGWGCWVSRRGGGFWGRLQSSQPHRCTFST